MLVQCKNCGAPLDVPDTRASHVKCSYCDASNKVRSMKTIAAMTPQGWAPPQQWQPPPHLKTQQLLYRGAPAVVAGAAGATGCANATGGVVTAFVIAVIAISVVVARSPDLLSRLPFFSWDGSAPFRCGGNESVTIEGVTANLPGQTAIVIEANCEVQIVDSHLTAWEGIRAEGNRRVVVRNSTIVATGTGIAAGGNKEIELVGSTVEAGGTGVEAGGNVLLTVSGGRVSGQPSAVVTRGNARLDLRGGQLVDGAGGPAQPGTWQ